LKSAQSGCAVGKGGVILVTQDGGVTWTRRLAKVMNAWGTGLQTVEWDFQGLGYADAINIYVVGQVGTIMRSSDGGTTWRDESLPRSTYMYYNLTSISFFGPGRAFATAQGPSNRSYVFRYTYTAPPDTFTQWTKRTSGSTANLYAVDFVDTANGWAVGTGGTILRTTNGGSTWTRGASVPGLGDKLLSGVDFVDRQTGWVIGNKYPASSPLAETAIYRTDDGGRTWSRQTHPNDGTFVFRVRMRNKNEGWILGEQWRVDQSASPPPKPYSSILHTIDGGVTWVRHKDSPPDLMRDISFADSNAGWAVGYRGSDYKTTDGGVNWTRMPSLSGIDRVMGVAFTSATKGVVAGDLKAETYTQGVVARTADGGATWSKPFLPTFNQLRCVTGIGEDFWVSGENGTILRSGDAGATWGIQGTGVATGLWGVQARSPDFIVAVGTGGTILTGRRPYASLSAPAVPSAIVHGKSFAVSGTLKPRHSGTTQVALYRLVNRVWKPYLTAKAPNSNYLGYSRWTFTTSLPYAGTWSAIASFGDRDHAPSGSSRAVFAVK
jgi:photosystem II stability/assembly factor-like uncharacterized protein